MRSFRFINHQPYANNNFVRVLIILVGTLGVGMGLKYMDNSPDDYISSAEADKYRIMNYYELGKSVGRTSLLEYISRFENDSLQVNLQELQAIEDSIQQVQMEERFGQSIYE